MSIIRVLIVDDSAVVRHLVREALSVDPQIEIAGTASNGKMAVERVLDEKPDLVTLDVEMPVMDGLEAVAKIREHRPDLPVIMFSSLTEQGANITLEALARGASDYVAKPVAASKDEALAQVRDQLIPKIHGLCRPRVREEAPAPAPAPEQPQAAPAPRRRKPRAVPRRAADEPPAVVAFGVSTGGPNALADVLPDLPPDFPVPIVIVQHMPPVFTAQLAQRLDAKSKIAVQEAAEGMALRPGCAYIAPGDHHMRLERQGTAVRIRLDREPQVNSCRPAVDPLFDSVADVYGAASLAVVLTGMGRDGVDGCASVKEMGGRVFTQDEETSVVWGMPGLVTEAGLSDRVLPLNEVASEITRVVGEVG